jgi:hypothetical protein
VGAIGSSAAGLPVESGGGGGGGSRSKGVSPASLSGPEASNVRHSSLAPGSAGPAGQADSPEPEPEAASGSELAAAPGPTTGASHPYSELLDDPAPAPPATNPGTVEGLQVGADLDLTSSLVLERREPSGPARAVAGASGAEAASDHGGHPGRLGRQGVDSSSTGRAAELELDGGGPGTHTQAVQVAQPEGSAHDQLWDHDGPGPARGDSLSQGNNDSDSDAEAASARGSKRQRL